MRSRILGTGSYVPRCQFAKRGDAPSLASGPEARRKNGNGNGHGNGHAPMPSECRESVSDLALVAALETVAAAGCEVREIDCIVLASEGRECGPPGSAGVLGAKLGVPGVPAFDIHNPSGGFLYGLSMADHFVRLGTHARVLVAAAETRGGPDGTLPPELGAALVTPAADDQPGILGTGLHADGRFARVLTIPFAHAPGDAPVVTTGYEGSEPAARVTDEVLADCYQYLRETMRESLAVCELSASDVALFVLNQASAPLVPRLARDLGVAPHRMVAGAGERATAAPVSIPAVLDGLVRGGGIRRGDVVALCSFGTGFVWAWTVVRW
jgi:3-oxoacyl-[acyl-carrier-protein] synthase-3